MNGMDTICLQQLQDEISPILNKIMDNSTELKEILQKFNLLEATELQLKLNTSKLNLPENIELQDLNGSKLRFNPARFQNQTLNIGCTSLCVTCGNYRQCGTCPQREEDC